MTFYVAVAALGVAVILALHYSNLDADISSAWRWATATLAIPFALTILKLLLEVRSLLLLVVMLLRMIQW